MRILLIHNYLSYRGGEDRCFDLLVNLLKNKGHELYIFTKDSRSLSTDPMAKINAAVGMFISRPIEKEMIKIIKEFKPNIVHISNIFPLITPEVYIICKKYKLPIIQSVHSYRYLCPKSTLFRNGKTCELCVKKSFSYPAVIYGCYHNSRLASLFLSTSNLYHQTRNLLNLVDKFIFPAVFARDYYVKYMNIPINKTIIIPNFVESIANKVNKKDNYFLFVGRFAEEKGILPLLKLFSSLPQLNLTVIGDGSLKSEVLKHTSRNIKIKTTVPKEQVYNYMRKALAVIIPSAPLYEFGPLVLIESFANGTPVVVPNSGVFKERIIDGKTGIFYKPESFDDLKSKLLYLNKNNQKLMKMGVYVRTEYEKKYTSDIYYKMLLKTYWEAIK